MRYLDKIKCFIQFGNNLAKLSTCKRAQVAAIVFPCDCTDISAIGYNGPVCGQSNNSCSDIVGKCGCAHAEGNAIAKLTDRRPSIMYCTTTPCIHCANMIINCGTIVGCIIGGLYRNNTGLYALQRRMTVLDVKGLIDDNVREWWEIGTNNRRVAIVDGRFTSVSRSGNYIG